MHKYLIKQYYTEIMGYAPGLALQVSGVNEVFWSGLNGVLLLFLCSWLLDRLSN